ncbi:MAG TPA: serine/threonine-protein kinase, partial [Caulobacteraceae bacterium]|nr:serine/threonine-protein kinase [Caulobacteraceae bacterium]
AGVVHRDIKPANLLLGPDGQLKIMDFGISRVAASRMTEAGQVMGTPNYMSPEQFRGEGVDQRTDIFAAGVVLYELLTGAPPLAGASMTEVMVKLLHDRVDLVPPDAPLPGPLRQVAACAMALDKEARYASASAMAEALDRAMAGLAAGGAEAAETLYAAPAPVAPAPRPATARLSADTETLALIERSAARRVGPLASRLVKDALKTADSLDGLCQSLAAWIEPEAERAAFLAEMKQRLANASVPPVGAGTIVTALSMSELDEIQRDLIRILGPFAKVLVKRAAGAARTGADLRAALAAHIDDPREREAFLANH